MSLLSSTKKDVSGLKKQINRLDDRVGGVCGCALIVGIVLSLRTTTATTATIK
jgi:hypothetical protein